MILKLKWNCKLCGNSIMKEFDKPFGVASKDYSIAMMSKTCIPCLRRIKQDGISNLFKDRTDKQILEEASENKAALRISLKQRRHTLIRELKKQGLNKKEIDENIKKFDKVLE